MGRGLLAAILCTTVVLRSAAAPLTGWNRTAAGTYDYTNTDNWVSGTVNDTFDASLTLAGAQTNTFAAAYATLGDWTFRQAGNYALIFQADGAADRTLTLNGNLIWQPTNNVALTVGSTNAGFGLALDLGGAARTVTNAASKNVRLVGPVGNGGLVKDGGGILYLGGAIWNGSTYFGGDPRPNTFTGLVVNAGSVTFSKNSGVNALAGGTLLINAGGTVTYISGNGTIKNNKQLDPSVDVVLNGGTFTLVADNTERANSFILSNGIISVAGSQSSSAFTTTNPAGTGVLRLAGGSWTLRDRNPTWTTDRMVITGGTNLISGNNSGLGTGAAQLTVGAGGLEIDQPPAGAMVPLLFYNSISGATFSYAKLNLNGNATVVGDAGNTNPVTVAAVVSGTGVAFQNQIVMTASRTFTVGNGGSDVDLALEPCMVGTGGALVKEGTGTLALNGVTNSYTGLTTVNAGRLLVNGLLAAQNTNVLVNNNGTLGGTGTISRALVVAQGGTLAPGSASAPGVLTVNSNVSLAASAVLAVRLQGPAAGTDYDQLAAGANVSVTNAQLSVSLGFTPTAGSQFTLIANNGANPVYGAFAGLAEGSIFTTGGRSFRITYKGPDGVSGNDVLLTTLPRGTIVFIR
jgi:autotransporter-associated beta strand protein